MPGAVTEENLGGQVLYKLGVLSTQVDRLQAHVEGVQGRITDMREDVQKATRRNDDHTSRLIKLEKDMEQTLSWRLRISTAITVLMAVVAAGASILGALR
jgi:outer membrane murein-binding lipoprotein Lpp